jgi:hypothetical protein
VSDGREPVIRDAAARGARPGPAARRDAARPGTARRVGPAAHTRVKTVSYWLRRDLSSRMCPHCGYLPKDFLDAETVVTDQIRQTMTKRSVQKRFDQRASPSDTFGRVNFCGGTNE